MLGAVKMKILFIERFLFARKVTWAKNPWILFSGENLSLAFKIMLNITKGSRQENVSPPYLFWQTTKCREL